MEWVNRNIRGGRGLGSTGVLGGFRSNTRWARVSSIVDAELEDSADVMDCNK